MKRLLACAAMIAAATVGACAPPAETPTSAAQPAAAAPVSAAETPLAASAISLAGKWAGTVTCYKIESPFQMTIDVAKPGEAVLSKGESVALSWPATYTVSEVARLVTILSTGPADGAERVEGLLSEDGATFSGVMDKQLCTDFTLKRQS